MYEDLHDSLVGVRGEWTLQRCGRFDCRLIWLNSRSRADEFEKAYQTYYTHAEDAVQADISARAIFAQHLSMHKNGYLTMQFDYQQRHR
jgi:hypothetical protein